MFYTLAYLRTSYTGLSNKSTGTYFSHYSGMNNVVKKTGGIAPSEKKKINAIELEYVTWKFDCLDINRS
jgi:hypothetical protein